MGRNEEDCFRLKLVLVFLWVTWNRHGGVSVERFSLVKAATLMFISYVSLRYGLLWVSQSPKRVIGLVDLAPGHNPTQFGVDHWVGTGSKPGTNGIMLLLLEIWHPKMQRLGPG